MYKIILVFAIIINISCNRKNIKHADCIENLGIITSIDSLKKYYNCAKTLVLRNDTISDKYFNISSARELKSVQIFNTHISNLDSLFNSLGKIDSLQNLTLDLGDYKKIGPEIGMLKNIKSLTLLMDSVQYVSPDFFSLIQLKSLTIQSDDIWRYDDFKSFKNLKELGLLCKMTNIPEVVYGFNELEILDLSDNNIDSIPDRIGSLRHLEKIKIYNTNIEKAEIKNIQDRKGTILLPAIKKKCNGCKVLSNVKSFS